MKKCLKQSEIISRVKVLLKLNIFGRVSADSGVPLIRTKFRDECDSLNGKCEK